MITLLEGEKRDVVVSLTRIRGSGTWSLTSPQYRILDYKRAVITGYNWVTAAWDATESELSALFDSTLTGLTTVGIYYVQLRGTIGTERYGAEVRVQLLDWGP